MIGPLAAAGHRVAGAGSDQLRPVGQTDRTQDYTLCAPRRLGDVVADRAGPARRHRRRAGLGLADRAAGGRREPDRFSKLFIANGFLPPPSGRSRRRSRSGERSPSSPGVLRGVARRPGTVHPVPRSVRAGYDAPFPDRRYQAGRGLSGLVPTSPDGQPSRPTGRRGRCSGIGYARVNTVRGGVCLGWGGGFTSIVGVCSYLQSSGVR